MNFLNHNARSCGKTLRILLYIYIRIDQFAITCLMILGILGGRRFNTDPFLKYAAGAGVCDLLNNHGTVARLAEQNNFVVFAPVVVADCTQYWFYTRVIV